MGRADAGAHARLLAAGELGDQLGVGDVRTGHCHHVEQPVADRAPRCLQRGDAGCVKDREPHRLLEGPGAGQERRLGRSHARHAVHRELEFRVDAAVDRVEEIDGA